MARAGTRVTGNRFPAIVRDGIHLAAQQSVEAVADNVADDMRRLVPVLTGETRGTIDVDVERGSESARAYSDSEVAELLENGTHKMRAQPFARPAAYIGLARSRPELERIWGTLGGVGRAR